MKQFSFPKPLPVDVIVPSVPPRLYSWPDGPNTGRLNISSDSGTTTNWDTNEITFKKVLFTKPITVTDDINYTPTEVVDQIIIHASSSTRIYFDQCMMNGLTGSDSNLVNFTTNITTNSASTTDIIQYYDTSGNLITTRDGIFNAINFANLTPEQKRRQEFINRIKNKQAPAILNHRGITARAHLRDHKWNSARPEELVALQLLRRMVSSDVFRKYLRHGFVTVEGPSGLVYQIVRGNHHIKVWKQGTLVSELCVYLKDNTIPPTDEVVAKMIIVECDEIDIWRRANIYWRSAISEFKQLTRQTIEERHLRLVA